MPEKDTPILDGDTVPIPAWQVTGTHCSFCGRHKDVVEFLLVGPNAIGVCDECVNVAVNLILTKRKEKSMKTTEGLALKSDE